MSITALPSAESSPGLWTLAGRRLAADRLAVVCAAILLAFLLLTLASASGLVAADWSHEIGVNYAPPHFLGAAPAEELRTTSELPGTNPLDPLADDIAAINIERGQHEGMPATARADGQPSPDDFGIADPLADELREIHAAQTAQNTPHATPLLPQKAATTERQATLLFGGDKWGRDVLAKTIKGTETSIAVGLLAALIATLIGSLLGALAGYFGGWVDDVLNWFYSIFTSIPYLLLILAVAAVVPRGKGLLSIVLILSLTGWTGVFRQIRAEYLKHKAREYVQAANAIGASDTRMMFLHIFPNVSHVALVQLSLLAVGFIKSEVILSFLGFGVPVDAVSWGSMLNEAQNELILGKWWQLAAATTAMALLVTAFSLFTDALRDALDPRMK